MELIAALPTIFSAVRKITDLFNRGKETVTKVTGSDSLASTPEELQTEVEKMSPEQQNRWAEIMAKQVDMYAQQNQRLAMEIGLIDPNITGKISPEAASEIALLRMTTRPWTVRLMVHFVLFPGYLVIIDLAQQLIITWLPFVHSYFGITPFNCFEYVFGVDKALQNIDPSMLDKLASLFAAGGGSQTMAAKMYNESIPWVVSIILGYMGLRELGKARGHKDSEAPDVATMSPISIVSKTLADNAGLVSKVRDWFKNK